MKTSGFKHQKPIQDDKITNKPMLVRLWGFCIVHFVVVILIIPQGLQHLHCWWSDRRQKKKLSLSITVYLFGILTSSVVQFVFLNATLLFSSCPWPIDLCLAPLQRNFPSFHCWGYSSRCSYVAKNLRLRFCITDHCDYGSESPAVLMFILTWLPHWCVWPKAFQTNHWRHTLYISSWYFIALLNRTPTC